MKRRLGVFAVIFFISFLISTPLLAEAEGEDRGPPEDDFLEFAPPTECFAEWFRPESTPVGQPSCAKKLTRFKVDEINMHLQEMTKIMEYARFAAREAGWAFLQGTQTDLTAIMNEQIQAHAEEDKARFGDQNISFEVIKFILERGMNATIGEDEYEIWKVAATMSSTFGTETFTDVITMEVAKHPTSESGIASDTETRIIEFTGSFGQGGFILKGKFVSNTADDSPVSLNMNFEMKDEGGNEFFECVDPNDPDTCTASGVASKFEQTIALEQTFAEGLDAGKLQWTESGLGGEPPDNLWEEEGGGEGDGPPVEGDGPRPPVELAVSVDQSGPPEGGFNNTMTAGWDTTGAGCLEMEQDYDAIFKEDARYAGLGGGFCGSCVDGTDNCEAYKKGRKYSAILKVEDVNNVMFKGCVEGRCQMEGEISGDEVPPEFRIVVEGGPPPEGEGFRCTNPQITNDCDGYCVGGLSQGAPDPLNCDSNTEAQAWVMGCAEGLMFEDDQVEGIGGAGTSARKGECWDASGLVVTTSDSYLFTDRDPRIDKQFDYRDNFGDEEEFEFQRPEGYCQVTFDEARHVELKPDGSEFCVPDFFADDNSAADTTPLCSQTTSGPCS